MFHAHEALNVHKVRVRVELGQGAITRYRSLSHTHYFKKREGVGVIIRTFPKAAYPRRRDFG